MKKTILIVIFLVNFLIMVSYKIFSAYFLSASSSNITVLIIVFSLLLYVILSTKILDILSKRFNIKVSSLYSSFILSPMLLYIIVKFLES